MLPPGRDMRVGTGCVWDGHYRGVLTQTDLILFENTPAAVLYDSYDVVVVRESVVRAIVSVKTNLSKQDVESELKDYLSLLKKKPRTLLIFFAANAEPVGRDTADTWLQGVRAPLAQIRIIPARWGTGALGPSSRGRLTPNPNVLEELSRAVLDAVA